MYAYVNIFICMYTNGDVIKAAHTNLKVLIIV